MTRYQTGKSKITNIKHRAVTGYKRFSVFSNATALAVLAAHAGMTVYNEIQHGDHDAPTILLTLATVLVSLTALVLYVKFFTEDQE